MDDKYLLQRRVGGRRRDAIKTLAVCEGVIEWMRACVLLMGLVWSRLLCIECWYLNLST